MNIANGTNVHIPQGPKRVAKYNPKRPQMYLASPVHYKPHLEAATEALIDCSVGRSTIVKRRMTDFVSRHDIAEKKVNGLISSGYLSMTTPVRRRRASVCIPNAAALQREIDIDKKQPAEMLFIRDVSTEEHNEYQRLLAEKKAATEAGIQYI